MPLLWFGNIKWWDHLLSISPITYRSPLKYKEVPKCAFKGETRNETTFRLENKAKVKKQQTLKKFELRRNSS